MILEQGKIRDEYVTLRHDRDMDLINKNYEEVRKELDDILAKKKAADDIFRGKTEL